MLQDFLKEKDTIIRCDLGQMPKEELVKALEGEGVHVEEHPYLPYALRISSYNYLGELENVSKKERFRCRISAPCLWHIWQNQKKETRS